MPVLTSDLRRVLENAVVAARDEATSAATAALKRLAVATKEFPNYLGADERVLRQKLRAAARQLGDSWNADKQAFASLDKLTHEVAYEHWHRMLFARFLAENNLLIHPEHGVPVDLATVADLAGEEARKTGLKADTWALAGRYAAAMLPQIFRPDDPALAVVLAPEHQQGLEKILESLPPQVFTADDSLGWVYQFWQSAEKDRVNGTVKAGAKITGETLPAVTQLFTEHYMVLFLLHNTIGAWHAGKVFATPEWQRRAAECSTEAELREVVALPGYSFEYLRFVKDESPAKWRPAAGTFDGWPKASKDLRVIDPCCGSGHFLVAALDLLAKLRIQEEGVSVTEAAAAVIADNLFGLELDRRCTQIAAFNIALAAWKLSAEHFQVADMHIACSGLGPAATLDQWLKLADKSSKAWAGIPNHARQAITNGLTNLHRLFSQAPELGSLIDPAQLRAGGELFSADWETLQPFLVAAMTTERDDEVYERAVAAQGMAKAAEILSAEYTLVITNVPYKKAAELGPSIAGFMKLHYPDAKNALETVFVSRIMSWLATGGTAATVTPQSWLSLVGYKKLRERLLRERTWNMLARLGTGAFETIGGHVVNVALVTLSEARPRTDEIMAGIDASAPRVPADKAAVLRGETVNLAMEDLPANLEMGEPESGGAVEPPSARNDGSVHLLPQVEQLKNPDARIILGLGDSSALLNSISTCFAGILNGDTPKLQRRFWEIAERGELWSFQQTTVEATEHFGGHDRVIYFDEAGGHIREPEWFRRERLHDSDQRGNQAWGKLGVAVSSMGDLPVSLFTGAKFDSNVAVILAQRPEDIPAIWCFCQERAYHDSVRRIDHSLKVTNASLVKVPFDLSQWQKVAAEKYPKGLPKPQTDTPTQWLFHGHPAGRVPLTHDHSPVLGNALQVAVARLMGYRWPAEIDAKMCLASEARAWVEKCEALEQFADDDGVVPLVPINKEQPGVERLRTLLESAFGNKWSPGLLNDLLAAAGSPGKSLDEWVKHEFFAQHCTLFQHRPFVWQIWDGKKDGFNILVHYHRLAEGDGKGHKLLQKITYTYLGDWIAQQQAAAKRGEPGADTRLKAAQDLQKKLEAIIAGDPPYDIFVRWKPLHEQPIGWNPDINDGVRQNARPFIAADVFRKDLSKILKTKDRGKEPESLRPKAQFPWFWSCPEDDPPVDFMGGDKFTGERLNDLHYTRKAKESARAKGGHG